VIEFIASLKVFLKAIVESLILKISLIL